MKSIAKWIWFAEKCGAGSSEMICIYEKFGSVNEIYLSDYNDYINNDVSERLAEALCEKSLDGSYSTVKFCQDRGIGILTYSDEKYPKSLRSLKDPPAVLYYVGKLPDLNKNLCISAVGTRKMSEYGMRAAYKIAYEAASSDAIIISGMALGIDSVAASAAIAANGRTLAVLGCGIDVVYPKEHARLYNAIKEHGAVISEYPPSTEPHGYNFPVRNRIISGLSQGTVVIDANMKSGALITAKTAILQGRDLYAVPSNIDSENSSGTNSLIRDGAQAVLCGYDIVKNYAYLFRDTLNIQKMRKAEASSEFDPQVLSSLGVRARGAGPAFGGVASYAEKASPIPKDAKADKADREKSFDEGISEKAETRSQEKSGAGDKSKVILESLSERQQKIFAEMPIDRAISVDYLVNAGFDSRDVMSAFTILGIKGLVSCLPGGLYIRK